MKIKVPLLLLIAAVLLSACDMGKHYARLRIDHPEQNTEEIKTDYSPEAERLMQIGSSVSPPEKIPAEIVPGKKTGSRQAQSNPSLIKKTTTKSVETKPVHFLPGTFPSLKKNTEVPDIEKQKAADPGYTIVMISSITLFAIGLICLLTVTAPLGHTLFYIFVGIACVVLIVYLVQMLTA